MNETKKTRVMFAGLVTLCTLLFGAWLDRALADRSPTAPPLVYSGTALMGGVPISDGMHDIGIVVSTRSSGAVGAVCFEGPAATQTRAGRFSIPLTMAECGNAIQQGNELYVEVTVDGMTLTPRTRIGAVPYAVQAENGVPPGTVMAYAGETVPLGWVVCDGRALNGADAQYAALRAAIGTTWGTGTTDADPATDFNIPDLRGRFLRGFDDAATARDDARDVRTASAPGGRTGAHVGTLEDDATAAPTVPFVTATAGAHDHQVALATSGVALGNIPFGIDGAAPYRNLAPTGLSAGPTGSSGDHTHTISGGGDAETRPENAAVLYIIKL